MLLLWVALSALPACSLQRGVILCSEGSAYEPGSLCVPLDSGDASMLDGGMPEDGDVLADADIDAWLPDADAGPLEDAGEDAGSDGGRDSGPIDGGMRRCEDTTEGMCFRVDGVAIADWAAQFNWTRPGGSLHTIDWMDGQCIGGVRDIDADTTECEIAIPDPGTTVIDTGLAYAYPISGSGFSPCTTTGCPNYHTGYRLWIRGIEYSTDPATPGGRCSLENRPTLDGMHAVIRINLP